MKKIILHLCADLGSDSRFYQLDPNYEVIMVGEKIGVQNYQRTLRLRNQLNEKRIC